MVRGFLEEGYPLYCGADSRKIIPNVRRLLEQEKAKGSAIIFVCDNHDLNDREFRIYPPHCIKGTVESEVVPELTPYATEVLPKKTYSGFYGTVLEKRLAEVKPEKVIVCGVCTEICVLHTASEASLRGYDVEVPADCVASFDPEGHKFGLRYLERPVGARVVGASVV